MWYFHLISFINLSLDLKCFHWKCYVQNSIKYQKLLMLILIISSRSFFLPLSFLPSFSFFLFVSFLFSFSFFFKIGNTKAELLPAVQVPATFGQLCTLSSHVTVVTLPCITLSKSFECQHCLGLLYCCQLYTDGGPEHLKGEKKMSCLCLGTFCQLHENKVRKQMYIISSKIYIKHQLCAPPVQSTMRGCKRE